jgi:hypothetical protein
MMLWLSFGGKPCPFEWGVISKTICDLANAILLSKDWDPKELFSPNQQLVLERELLDNDVPFAKGTELIVNIPSTPVEFTT